MTVTETSPEKMKALQLWDRWVELGFCSLKELAADQGMKIQTAGTYITLAKQIRDAEREVYPR